MPGGVTHAALAIIRESGGRRNERTGIYVLTLVSSSFLDTTFLRLSERRSEKLR